ncbi:MAG: dihydrodipicolinate synthase family protein, partial [Planctomycetota bacterium]
MNTMRSNWNPIHGLVAATFTPLQTDGSLDLDAIPEVCESVLAQGADGLFLCGSTGEGPSLTVEERIQVSEAYLQAAAGRVPVI